jgi:hypothetical protein
MNRPVGPSICGKSAKHTSTLASNSFERNATERVSRSTLLTTSAARLSGLVKPGATELSEQSRANCAKPADQRERDHAQKVLAADQETTLNALAVEAFNDLLKKHGKRTNVENPLLN